MNDLVREKRFGSGGYEKRGKGGDGYVSGSVYEHGTKMIGLLGVMDVKENM